MAPPELPGGLEATAWRPLSGGSICNVWRVRLTDGTNAVVKATPYDADLEREGLEALAGAGADVPQVLACDTATLVLSEVTGPADWARVGRTLAGVHRSTSPTFGWHRDNLLGALPQDNTPTTDWAAFFADRRLRPFMDAPALPDAVRARVDIAIDERLAALFSHGPTPSLVHGDLWPGNVVAGRWFVDPAVHYADREYELAVTQLFGGVPPAMKGAYEEVWPLPDGWHRRRPALQLPHLLAHVKMFGSGYVPAVVDRLDALNW